MWKTAFERSKTKKRFVVFWVLLAGGRRGSGEGAGRKKCRRFVMIISTTIIRNPMQFLRPTPSPPPRRRAARRTRQVIPVSLGCRRWSWQKPYRLWYKSGWSLRGSTVRIKGNRRRCSSRTRAVWRTKNWGPVGRRRRRAPRQFLGPTTSTSLSAWKATPTERRTDSAWSQKTTTRISLSPSRRRSGRSWKGGTNKWCHQI